ncbi:MAG TPA: hypothetical protein VFK54_05250, partial [Candidatus Limnocylindrales bacterium]|nr:hypothetical protein [Candidatus Limnocylindrales bacterium]
MTDVALSRLAEQDGQLGSEAHAHAEHVDDPAHDLEVEVCDESALYTRDGRLRYARPHRQLPL